MKSDTGAKQVTSPQPCSSCTRTRFAAQRNSQDHAKRYPLSFEARTVAGSSLAERFWRKLGPQTEPGMGARSPGNTRAIKLRIYDDDADDDPDDDAVAEYADESSHRHPHHHDDQHQALTFTNHCPRLSDTQGGRCLPPCVSF